jgi:acyl-CoA synthetase (NDP forming)
MVKARNHRKPVIALKTGRSEQGARVTMSHTSSLAGSDALYDALFERYGLARVTTITEFVETLKFLHHGGALAGGRCVSMSCSGGEAALVADLALDRKLSFPPFAPETAAKVAATLNAYVAIDNPLDYHTFIWGDRDKLTATFAAVLAGGFDVGMLILDTPDRPRHQHCRLAAGNRGDDRCRSPHGRPLGRRRHPAGMPARDSGRSALGERHRADGRPR